jgi:hypothetical protein
MFGLLSLPLFEIESHLLGLAGELEWRRVIEIDRLATVLSDVLTLVQPVLESRGLFDTAFTELVAVGDQ